MQRGERPRPWVRFYVWLLGWNVCAGWRVVEPEGVNATDCTDMTDSEFDQFVMPMLESEHENTSPGHPGDPGRF